MRGLNRASLIGNAGADPEFQILDGGVCVAKFSLATTEVYKDKLGVTHTDTEWHSIVAWRSIAQIVQKYVHKGSHVFVEGKIKTRSYDDKDGNKKYVHEIIAESILLLDKATTKVDINDSL